jgi:hypothetical protein
MDSGGNSTNSVGRSSRFVKNHHIQKNECIYQGFFIIIPVNKKLNLNYTKNLY